MAEVGDGVNLTAPFTRKRRWVGAKRRLRVNALLPHSHGPCALYGEPCVILLRVVACARNPPQRPLLWAHALTGSSIREVRRPAEARLKVAAQIYQRACLPAKCAKTRRRHSKETFQHKRLRRCPRALFYDAIASRSALFRIASR